MAAPTFRAAGAKATGAGGVVLTPAAPAGLAIGDLEFLIVSKDVSTDFVLSNTGGSAWTHFGEMVGSPGAEHTDIWWRIRQSGDTNPQVTIPAGAGHGIGARFAVVAGTFDPASPIELFSWVAPSTASASFSHPMGSTLGSDRLIFCVGTSPADSNSQQVPIMTNAALTGLTQVLGNHATNVGDGGGFGATCGVKAVAGAAGTFACTYAASALQVRISWAVKPVPPPPPPDDETLLDNFDRADGQLDAGAGGAIWTQTYYDNPARTDLRIVGNRLAGIATWQSAHTKFELSENFDLLIDCVVPPATPNFEFGMFFSMTDVGTSLFDGYGYFWGNGSWFMRRYTNGVNQGNIATATGPLLAGDTLWVRKRGSDIKIYRRPSGGEYALLMSATDATYGAGKVVIELSDTTQRWDNLRGGPLAVPKSYGAFSLPITFGKSVEGIRTPASLYRAAVVADGPAGYWRLNEAGGSGLPAAGALTLNDSNTGGGIAGLLPNEPTSKGRWFIAANGSSLSGGSRPYQYNTLTWETWVKRNRMAYEALIDQYNGGMRLSLGADGTINLDVSWGNNIAKTLTLKVSDLNAHHIAVSRNGIGGEVVFYLDGVAEVGTPGAGFSHDITPWANYSIFLGSSGGTSPFDGTLDEVAIYSTVLTPAQIQNHYDVGAHVPTTVYGSFSLPVSFNKEVKGQRKAFGQVALPVTFSKAVGGQRKTFGQVARPIIFSKAVSAQRKTFGQIDRLFTFGSVISGNLPPPPPLGTYVDEILADNPISYWRLGNNVTIHDEMGVTPDVMSTGGWAVESLLTSDQVDDSILFDGGDDTITFPNISPHAVNNGSLELWVKTIEFGVGGGYRGLFVKSEAYGIFMHDNQLMTYDWELGGGGNRMSGVFLNDNVRHHVVMTFQSGVVDGSRFYVDGVAVGAPFKITVKYQSTDGFRIACNMGTQLFRGNLDEVAFYDRVLSPAKIARHYDAGINEPVSGTRYGKISAEYTFGKDTKAVRKTFGQVALPVAFSKDVRGERKTFGQVSLPLNFSKAVSGNRKTYGQIVFPINAFITTAGIIRGTKKYGALSLPVIFGKDLRAQRKTFGQIAFPIIFSEQVQGRKKTFSSIAFPINASIVTAGIIRGTKKYGALSFPIVFSKEVVGRRWMYGKIASPFVFGAIIQGRRKVRGKIALPMYFAIDVGPGHVGVHGQLAFPITFDSAFIGLRTHGAIILNDALAIYLGIEPVEAVYVGEEQVWPTWSPLKISGLVTWLDANDYVSNYWPNKGSGPAITVAGSPPMTIGPLKNGQPVVRFKTSEGRIRSAWPYPFYEYTLIYLVRWVGPGAGRAFSVQYPPSNLLVGMHTSYPDAAYDNGTWFGAGTGWNTWTPGPGPWRIYGADSSQVEGFRFYINGLQNGSPTHGIGGLQGGWGISGYESAGPGETMDIEVPELLLYNRKLPDAERQQLETYLRTKWGV